MADKKHWHDWLALGISLLSLAIAGITAYRNVFFQRDDVRFVAGDSLKVGRNENDEFRIEEDQEFTFINSGNRQAVITEIYGTLVLVTDSNARCANRLAKNIIINANKIVLKPGEIQLLRAKVAKDYPWEKGKGGLYSVKPRRLKRTSFAFSSTSRLRTVHRSGWCSLSTS